MHLLENQLGSKLLKDITRRSDVRNTKQLMVGKHLLIHFLPGSGRLYAHVSFTKEYMSNLVQIWKPVIVPCKLNSITNKIDICDAIDSATASSQLPSIDYYYIVPVGSYNSLHDRLLNFLLLPYPPIPHLYLSLSSCGHLSVVLP